MTKDELITKQQLEIEELKATISENKEDVRGAMLILIHAEQWSTKCDDFPGVAMSAIVRARDALESV
jgi:hypothetical protein